jgi:hypothetical protein
LGIARAQSFPPNHKNTLRICLCGSLKGGEIRYSDQTGWGKIVDFYMFACQGGMKMKRILVLAIVLSFLLVAMTVPAAATNGCDDCTTIQDGIITYSAGHYLAGEPLTVGYDIFGYNYQGHMFKGSYANVYLGAAGFPPYEGDDESYLAENPGAASHWAWPYREVQLVMKWNDAWLSNKDCDGDGKLDRHFGFTSYIGSGAWETNHMWGEDDGTVWTYFTKIVAAPADAVLVGGIWYTAGGTEIGPAIWGEFATIQEVETPGGLVYLSPASAGFGYYAP